jgi:hypothetical protein
MEQKRRRRLGAVAWRGLLTRQGQSGMPVEQFCRSEGVSAGSFYRWRTKLAGGAGKAVVSVPAEPKSAFVELGRMSEARGRVEVRLELGDGLVLTVVR